MLGGHRQTIGSNMSKYKLQKPIKSSQDFSHFENSVLIKSMASMAAARTTIIAVETFHFGD